MTNHEPTVFVVDDDEAVRESLRALARSVGFPVEQFASAADFLATYDPNRPGCLVLDVRMRGMSGLDLQEELGRLGVHIPVIIITGHGDIAMAVRAMRAGAVDFIEKPFRDQALLDRIQAAIDGDRERRRVAAARQAVQDRLDKLTERERQVLDLLLAGRTNKEIASDLGVGLRSIESHRARLMDRLQATSVSELIQNVIFARTGITLQNYSSRQSQNHFE